ncbi:pyroglutamyl-peptidase I [Clostridium fallax]|uniref:Pyrrolidone-carboxylate peptidase n=1 Tax=Clostridium fallax TaxID=1533 RepID=A0A1M4Z2C1_9CLOT|nr:pyroglutamyl-peptidase I [Clostridium fallax]SHF12224.1 pyroglutamyl-peptidase [Clostridium fallax]SQB22285.1 pyrrolidone-carboxylate peptidase [Clostridium fallax]
MNVLITGFEPFGGENINPSLEAINKLNDNLFNCKIVKLKIPTVFYKSIRVLENAIKKYNPDVVICIGQAAGRSDITLERVAININDASIEDNENNKPIDCFIFEDGENAYFSTLPIKSIVNEIRNNNIPASISNSAGTFVCNHLMYGLLYLINKKYNNIKGGFMHIPCLPSQAINKKGMPSMDILNIVNALEIAIKISITCTNDVKISEGSIC